MATIGLLTGLATQQAYDVNLATPSGNLVREVVLTFTTKQLQDFKDAGYSGQLIQDTATHEYFLTNRGTELGRLSNIIAGIGITLGFNSDQFASAQTYAKEAFKVLAQKLMGSEQVGTVYLAGHSSGYGQAIRQYEALLELIQAPPAPGEFDFRPYYEQLKSKVRLFGIAGTGVPKSNLPVGALDGIAVNLIMPGDIIDDVGKQYGIKITLDGAGSGYGSVILGAAGAGVLGATGLGVLAAGTAGGIAGNHPGKKALEFLQKSPALASLDDRQLAQYSAGERAALVVVDAFSWQAMTDLDRSALKADPVAVVNDLRAHGLTPASIAAEGQNGLRYTFANGVSYLYQDTGGVKTYAFNQTGGDPVTMSVYSDRTEYLFADNSSSVLYNSGATLQRMADQSTLYQLADGSGQLQVQGRQFAFGAGAKIQISDQGAWEINSPAAQGSQVLKVYSDGSGLKVDLDSAGNVVGTAQLGAPSSNFITSGTAALPAIPAAVTPPSSGPGVPYTQTNEGGVTSTFYDNGVVYINDAPAGKEYWSVPGESGGFVTTTKDAGGAVTTVQYDANRNPVSQQDYNANLQLIGRTTYDPLAGHDWAAVQATYLPGQSQIDSVVVRSDAGTESTLNWSALSTLERDNYGFFSSSNIGNRLDQLGLASSNSFQSSGFTAVNPLNTGMNALNSIVNFHRRGDERVFVRGGDGDGITIGGKRHAANDEVFEKRKAA